MDILCTTVGKGPILSDIVRVNYIQCYELFEVQLSEQKLDEKPFRGRMICASVIHYLISKIAF